MPPLFGLIANHTTISIFPYYLLLILINPRMTNGRFEYVLGANGVRYGTPYDFCDAVYATKTTINAAIPRNPAIQPAITAPILIYDAVSDNR